MDSCLARLGFAVAFLFVLAIVGGPLCHVRQYTGIVTARWTGWDGAG
jgi:hypothetical protein